MCLPPGIPSNSIQITKGVLLVSQIGSDKSHQPHLRYHDACFPQGRRRFNLQRIVEVLQQDRKQNRKIQQECQEGIEVLQRTDTEYFNNDYRQPTVQVRSIPRKNQQEGIRLHEERS